MSDREKKIAEIRETLEKATPGPWKWVDVYKKNDFEKYNMGGFVNEEGKLICHFGNRIDYYPTEGEPPDYYDELLIANAPEWLRFLLDELDRLRAERDSHGPEGRNYTNMQYVDLLMERDKLIEGLRMCLFNHGCWREEDYVAYIRDLLKEIGVTVE
jgi:hypothetical protein